MKEELLLLRNQLKMGHRISFAEAMLLQRAIDILVNKAGNSPAIPDGYVMVAASLLSELRDWAHPEIEEYCEMWAGRRDDEFPALRKVIADADALLAAAPQSPGSEPATVPGTWIPVSEKMPPSRHEVLVGSWWGEKSRWCCKWATYIPGHPDAQSSGWLIPGASWTPTHWMPLPAAPQEVKP
ncbi:TPA: DUF551 domain-containing protein [Klebsiella pneumoniae]